MKRVKQRGGISVGAWWRSLILAAVILPLIFCVSCGQTESPPVNVEDSSDISIAHIIEEEPEEDSGEVTGIALPTESSALVYVNQRLGFTIEFPVEWAGLIQLKEEYDLPHQNGGNCITIYHRETMEKESLRGPVLHRLLSRCVGGGRPAGDGRGEPEGTPDRGLRGLCPRPQRGGVQ